MYKKLYQAGFAAYLGLFVLSILFYKERIVNLDAALYLFNVVRTGTFSIEHFRYIAVLTEIFPLVATKLSLPLNMVMMSYSAGFIVYYFICYLLCGLVFKNHKLGLALLCYHILFTSYTFYWSLSEFIQGVSLMFPALAYLYNKTWNDLKPIPFILFIIVVAVLAFAHPLMLFPLSFALAFMFIDNRLNQTKAIFIVAGCIFIIVLAAKMLWVKEAYDSSAMQGLGNFVKLFPNYFDIYSNEVFLANCLSKYYWIPIIFASILVTYIVQKSWLKLLLIVGYVVGFTLLINISYPTDYTMEFYIENLYLPMGAFLAIPLVFDVFPLMRSERKVFALSAAILVTAFIRIYMFHPVFTARLDWERDFLKQYPNQKMMVDAKKINTEKLLMHWGTPYEFWLLSTTEYGKTASVIIHEDLNAVKWDMFDTDVLITNWGIFAYADLDKRYFIMTDTSTLYTVIE